GTEFGRRPLAGDHLPAEAGPFAHRPVDPRLAYPPALQVPGVAVEHSVLAGPVPFGGHEALPVGTGYPAPDQVDVGLLAGLDDAELAVDGGQLGDHPVGVRGRAAFQRRGQVPGGPAVAVVGPVVVGGLRFEVGGALQEIGFVVEPRVPAAAGILVA